MYAHYLRPLHDHNILSIRVKSGVIERCLGAENQGKGNQHLITVVDLLCSNFRFKLRNERAGPLKVQIVENEFAALFVSELHNKGHRTAGGSFRSTVSCKGTNGAHVGRGNSSNTALVGLDSEDLTVDSAKKLQERPSFAQPGIPPVEQHLGTAFEQATDEPGEGFATIEEAIEAIKEGKVC